MENESQTNKCPKCGGITSSGKAGTITQWIATCNCSVVTDNEDTSTEVVEICAACGKRINPGRSGTFTQWIFRLDLCSCAVPQPVEKIIDDIEIEPSLDIADPEISEPEEGIQIASEKFPIDRYKPISVLGKGSSGTVYLSWDRLLNKKIAVKTLHTLEQAQQVSFQREAQATSKLNHVNIIQVLDFGITSGGTPFMAMEFVDGQSLFEFIHSKAPLPIDQTLELFANVCVALAHAHSKGILHRDIKSSNILLKKVENNLLSPRIIDFGVAALQTKQNQEDSQSKTMVGSPAYMAPDTALGNEYDKRSEVYGVGCTLFEALTGRTPFISDSSLETIRQHAHDQAPLISEFASVSDFPQELIDLVDKCLAKEQDARYQNMLELSEELLSIKSSMAEVEKTLPSAQTIEWTPLKNITRVSPKVLFTLSIAVAAIGTSVMIMTTQRAERPEPNVVEPDLPITDLTDVIGEAVDPHFSIHNRGPDKLEVKSRGNITNSDLEQLKEKEAIHTLILAGNAITDEGLKTIVDIPINTLFVKGQDLTDESVSTLTKIKGLKSLDISKTKISDKGLEQIASTIKLTYLGFGGKNTENKSVQVLSKLKSLERLKLDNTRTVTSKGLLYLRKFPNLKELELHHCIFRQRDLNALSKLNLEVLGFSRHNLIQEKDLEFLSKMNLTELHFVRTRISTNAVRQLSPLKKLIELRFVHCGINDDQVKIISKIPNIKVLDIRGSNITSSGVEYLRKMKTLTQLDLRSCSGINGKDVVALSHSLPRCSISKSTAREKDNRAFAEVTNSLLESTNQMRKSKDRVWKK